MAVPGDAKVAFGSSSPWIFPDGTALVQTLSLDRQAGNATQPFRVETRVLLRQQGEWAGLFLSLELRADRCIASGEER